MPLTEREAHTLTLSAYRNLRRQCLQRGDRAGAERAQKEVDRLEREKPEQGRRPQ